ncbi:hypothetical protein MSG28_009100 [Choristoneura fumiferana]|uniref:Uncharacterized protein n=1 Tax=Choristoneura fumiferana TaxID=7141 RepID=A0ACC0KWV5_CHOFU|nr:hypothetical protein MSG28_009100 [Choristoneura fumiferana]
MRHQSSTDSGKNVGMALLWQSIILGALAMLMRTMAKRSVFEWLSLVYEELTPKTTRNCIGPEEKLFLTLRFIATGESFASLSFVYRISKSYISRVIRDVLKVLKQKLMPIAMPPSTKNDFKRIEKDFWEKWNMPNCISSIDGKHVRIRAPPNSGSLYFNYKDYFSIVMLALVDANYKFVAVDVGSYAYLEENSRPHYVRDENENPTDNMIPLTRTRGQANDGIHIREQLKLYFNSEIGQVAWQQNYY